jgi:hypothetical protein
MHRLVAIDLAPRTSIDTVAESVISKRLEEIPVEFFVETLDASDILFIDSSHEIRIGNDVITLLLKVIPALKPGVVIHFHDIFLPYEYPREWIVDNGWEWNEQYLVQAMMQGSDRFEVLWPGYFLQRSSSGFSNAFRYKPAGRASALWLRIRA